MNTKPKITISPAALEANEPEKPPKAFHEGFLSPHLKPKGKYITSFFPNTRGRYKLLYFITLAISGLRIRTALLGGCILHFF